MRTLAKVWIGLAIPTAATLYLVAVVRNPTLLLFNAVLLFCAITLAAAIYLIGTK